MAALCVGLVGCPTGPLAVELGTGEAHFEPWTDNLQPLPLVDGIQGGSHIWLSIRADGLTNARAQVHLEIEPTDGSLPMLESNVQIYFSRTFEDWRYVGWPAQLLDPDAYLGKEVRILVVLQDVSGATTMDERYGVVQPRALP